MRESGIQHGHDECCGEQQAPAASPLLPSTHRIISLVEPQVAVLCKARDGPQRVKYVSRCETSSYFVIAAARVTAGVADWDKGCS